MAKNDALDALLSTAEKKYGFRTGTLSDIAHDVQFLTTGHMLLDHVLGGGVPLGRSVEFFGPPSCGKTTVALQVAAHLQKVIRSGGDAERGISPDDKILYLDYEQAMDPQYAEALGLDIQHESFLFGQPDTLEAGANFTQQALETGRIRLVIIDSVAAMNPSAKAEAEIGKSLPAVAAKLLKDFGSNLNPILANNNATVIFLNHLMEKMEMGGRRPGMPPATTTPGGVALKFFASCRLEFKQVRNNMEEVVNHATQETEKIPTSTDVKVKAVKNKVAPPFRTATLRVRFGKGFDNYWTAVQVLLAHKRLSHTSGLFYFGKMEEIGGAPEWMARATTGQKRPYIKGINGLYRAAAADPDWAALLVAEAEKIVAESTESIVAVEPEDDDEADDIEDVLGKISAPPTGRKIPLQ